MMANEPRQDIRKTRSRALKSSGKQYLADVDEDRDFEVAWRHGWMEWRSCPRNDIRWRESY
ncbi:hypothetical protein AN958_06404 [Leucoagaricus sp. SymC.cos]|nr:hypothetical protein AN958_06404 [Leucoagaricus sp. SymC.cos]